jgi:hypothetical protein
MQCLNCIVSVKDLIDSCLPYIIDVGLFKEICIIDLLVFTYTWVCRCCHPNVLDWWYDKKGGRQFSWSDWYSPCKTQRIYCWYSELYRRVLTRSICHKTPYRYLKCFFFPPFIVLTTSVIMKSRITKYGFKWSWLPYNVIFKWLAAWFNKRKVSFSLIIFVSYNW